MGRLETRFVENVDLALRQVAELLKLFDADRIEISHKLFTCISELRLIQLLVNFKLVH